MLNTLHGNSRANGQFWHVPAALFTTLFLALMPIEILVAAELIILTREDQDPEQQYTQTDIIPLSSGDEINALRTEDDQEAVYSFSVSNASLVETLKALALSQWPDEVTSAAQVQSGEPRQSGDDVLVVDEIAHSKTITFEVEEASIQETIDQASIASACNIYIDDKTIVVDACDH